MINMLSFGEQTETIFAALQIFVRAGRGMGETRSKGEKRAAKESRKVPMRGFSQSLPMALLRAREAVMRQFRPILRQHGLTEQQWRILRALAAVDAIEVTELARVAFLLGPSLSRILRDLETRGLIQREVNARDLRRGVLSISAKGLRLIALVAPNSEAVYASISERYGARKLAALHKMLDELEQSVGPDLEPDDGPDE